MIVAKELSMCFGVKQAVRNISFLAAPGTVVGFLGPNGAGKTTTMRLLTGYLRPVSGTAEICGFDINTQTLQAQRQIGYLPESAMGFPNLTVREFLRSCAGLRGINGKTRLSAAVGRVCEMVDLHPALDTVMRELSKGWRQRAWLAQALLHNPPVLILDEPTDGLDPNQKRQVRRLIRELTGDKCILLSTHILEEAEEVCQRAIIVCDGVIVADDSTENLVDEVGRLAATFCRLTTSAPAPEPAHAE